MKRFKSGDNVIVISGLDKGRQGKVSKVLPEEDRVVVEGVNLKTRRVKARRTGQKGQVTQKVLPIHQSRVLPWCEKCKKGVRVRFETTGNQKVRVCVKCNSKI